MIDSNHATRWAASILGLAAACSSPERSTPATDGQDQGSLGRPVEGRNLAPVPWTDSFLRPAVLLAADIRIEGPRGLLRHVATVSNPEELDRVEKTLPEGFLQHV